MYAQGRMFILMRCILNRILQKKRQIVLNGYFEMKSLINHIAIFQLYRTH